MESLRKFISLSRFHIVMIAVGGSLVFGWLLTGTFQPLLALFVAIDWFLVNIINRIVDQQEDISNKISDTHYADEKKNWIYTLAILLYVSSFVLQILWKPTLTIPRLCYHLLGIIYNFNFIPTSNGKTRLKNVYFFKNSASNAGFLITIFGYPLAVFGLSSDISWAYLASLILFFALFELSFEIIYDLRDIKGDTLAGVKTYPVVHGQLFSARLIIVLNALAIMVVLLAGSFAIFEWKEIIFAVGPTVQLWIFLRAFKCGVTTQDCINITIAFALMLFGYTIWILAGLSLEFPFVVTPTLVVEIGLVILGFIQFRWIRSFLGTKGFWSLFLIIMASSWLAEHTAIEWYSFYEYSDAWHVFVGHVPLAIILIWPMVIISTTWLLKRVSFSGMAFVMTGTLIVILEALLIEVICVQADLWIWEGQGVFGVPLIGCIGWGTFAIGSFLTIEYLGNKKWILMPLISLVTTHLLLQILWRVGFKSISYTEISEITSLIGIGLLSFVCTLFFYKKRSAWNISMLEVVPRILSSWLIFYLLFDAKPSLHVVLFCLLYVPPYLILFTFEWRLKPVGIEN